MRPCDTMRHHDGVIILPTPPPLFHRCSRLGACNKGRDPGREGFFPEGNEIVVEVGAFGERSRLRECRVPRNGAEDGLRRARPPYLYRGR